MPDLKNLIDGIESQEKETSVLKTKIDRLTELIEKQKNIIAEQTSLIEEQRIKLQGQLDVPEDIIELKELITSQRVILNEKDTELDHARGELAQAKKELELMQTRMTPTQQKLEATLDTIGKVKTELAEKKSEIIVKDETIKTLASKVAQAEAGSRKLQEARAESMDEQSGVYQEKLAKYLKQIEELNEKHMNEKFKIKEEHLMEIQEMREEMSKLDFILLDSKLESTEKGSTAKDMAARFEQIRQKQESLIKNVEVLGDEKRVLNEDINRLQKIIDSLSDWKTLNKDKVTYFDKLSILMEQDPLFKAFLIVMEVGAIAIEDLQKALGSPIVIVKKNIQKLQEIDLIDIDDVGKIVLTKEENA